MAAHRYWRVRATGPMQDGGTIWSIAEMALASTTGGTNLASDGTAIASSYYNSDYTPSHAFNGVLVGNTGPLADCPWASSGIEADPWLGYDFGPSTAYQIVQVTIWPRTDTFFAGAPTSFDIDHSDDGAAWTTVASPSSVVWTQGNNTFADGRVFMAIPPPPPRRRLGSVS